MLRATTTAVQMAAPVWKILDTTSYIQVCWQHVMAACSQAVSIPVWHTPLLCILWKTPDDGQRNCPKHVEFYSKNKLEKLLNLVGFIIRIWLFYLILHYAFTLNSIHWSIPKKFLIQSQCCYSVFRNNSYHYFIITTILHRCLLGDVFLPLYSVREPMPTWWLQM